jgi:hypothetical protein
MKQNETKVIFSMALAAQLIERGHEVIAEMPNPENKKFTAWVFKVDETFYKDFDEIQRKE